MLGQATTGPGEWCWWFEPQFPWQAGRYHLVVDSSQEDLAGNSRVRVFDCDLTRPQDAQADNGGAAIEFTVD